MRGLQAMAIGLVLLSTLAIGANANAQGIVPGGWTSQVGYQSFQNPSYGYGSGFGTTSGAYGYGPNMPFGNGYSAGGGSLREPAIRPAAGVQRSWAVRRNRA